MSRGDDSILWLHRIKGSLEDACKCFFILTKYNDSSHLQIMYAAHYLKDKTLKDETGDRRFSALRCCTPHVLCDPSFPRHPTVSLLYCLSCLLFSTSIIFSTSFLLTVCPHLLSLCSHCSVSNGSAHSQQIHQVEAKWAAAPPTAGLIEPDRLLELLLTRSHIKHA